MGKIIKAAMAAGFVVLVERSVNGWLDKRAEKRAIAKAARTGFGTSTR
jgi:hypothetical protein